MLHLISYINGRRLREAVSKHAIRGLALHPRSLMYCVQSELSCGFH